MSGSDLISCPKCGRKISIGSNFCSNCGFDLRNFMQNINKVMMEAYRVKSTDPDTAFNYFKIGSKNGNEIAMFELGNLYFDNACSQAKVLDPSKRINFAQYCYARSAKKGYKQAIDKLRFMDESMIYIIYNSEAKEFLDSIKKAEKDKLRKQLEYQAKLAEERRKKEAEDQLANLRAERVKELEEKKAKLEKFLTEKVKVYNNLIDSIPVTTDIRPYIGKIDSIRFFLADNKWVRERINDSKKFSILCSLVSNEKKRIEDEKRKEENRKKIEHEREQKRIEAERKRKENKVLALFKEQFLNKNLYCESGVSYREGVITNLKFKSLDNVYAEVYFKDTNETKKWVLPDAIDKGFVSLENKWAPKPEKDMNYEEKETFKEKKYLMTVIKACQPNITAEYKAKPVGYIYNNPYDEDYDPQETADNIYTATMQSLWRDISMSPFFASVKTNEDGLFYIGKTSINNLVTDWRDPKCSIYYNFSTAMANKEIGLRLVRDHDIAYQRYKEFVDKFNTEREDYKENEGLNVSNLYDKYLVKLLEQSRDQKKTHDIIQTIQGNQYNIISNTDMTNMIVSGCAGSGKTMVLFHRVAYLAFNDINFKPEEFLIISSNKLLNDEAKELSKELQLGEIKNVDTYGLYYDFVNYYINSTNSCFILKNDYEGIMENEKAYSAEYLEGVYKTVEKLCLLKKKDFYDYYLNKVKEAFNHILNREVKNIRDIKKAINDNKNILEILKSVPLENLLIATKSNSDCPFFLKYLKKYLGKFGLTKADGENMYKSLAKNDVPSYHRALNYCRDNKISYQSVSYFDYRINDKSELVYLYDAALLLNMASNLVEYSRGIYNSLAMDIIEYAVSLDDEFALSNYSDKLFLYAYLLRKLGFKSEQKFKRTFVDEYQNYSKAELTFIKSLTTEGSLNLFGDQKQKIESKGIEFNDLKEFGIFNMYELKVNYRNAKKICELLNNEFNMSMISVGVTGKVETAKRATVRFTSEKDDSRTALIVKDLSTIGDDLRKFNIVSGGNLAVKRNQINVIPVGSIKGLEFEKVYVLNRDLTESERYLAYSRALNTLIIVEN